MSTPPLPALQVRTPETPDVIGQFSRVLQLRNYLQNAPVQQQILQQQAQLGQQQLQMGQQDMATRQALNAAYAGAVTKDANGNPTFDEQKLMDNLSKGPAAYQSPEVMKGITGYMKSRIDLQSSTADLQQKSADMLGSAAYAVKAAGYDPTLAHSLLDTLPASPQVQQIRAQIDNPQALRQLVDSAIANSPAQQKLQNAQTVARIRSNNVDMQEMNDWLQKNPGKTPADYQQFKVNQGVQAAVQKETNPAVQQNKIAVATAEGQARANIQAQIARGSNAALAQVPPHLVAPATAAAQKAGSDYTSAMSVAQDLQDTLAAAKRGNVVAYQVLPQEGTLQITTTQGVKRINLAEIENYAGGGSLLQRLMGHVGKAVTGKSIPDSVLNDMSEIQAVMQKGAQAKYNNELNVINQNYGAAFRPVPFQNTTTPSGAGSPLKITLPSGKQITIE